MKFHTLKNILLILIILISSTYTCIGYGELEYTVKDMKILNYIREGSIDGIIRDDTVDILQIVKPDKTYKDGNIPILPYKVYSENKLIAEIIIITIDGYDSISVMTANGNRDNTKDEILLCEYNIDTHTIVGEEQKTRSIAFESNTAVYNSITPMVQVDRNGIGRNWCFLTCMAEIINHYENTEYTTQDLADKYLNYNEANYSVMNNDGYISNRPFYTGASTSNIRYVLEYRGYRLSDTTSISYSKAKRLVDSDNTALLIFDRYPREVGGIGEDTEITEPSTPNEYFDTLLGRHSVVVYGYDPLDRSIIVADSSPLEEIPGPYTPTISKLYTNANKTKYYLMVRENDKINDPCIVDTYGDNIYKVYILTNTFQYGNGNIYSNYVNTANIVGQHNKQLSAFACLAEIYRQFEDLNKTAEEVAQELLPLNVYNYIDDTEFDIFSIPLGSSMNTPYFDRILGLRGYSTSGNMGFKSVKLDYLQSFIEMGWGVGLMFDIVEPINNSIVGKHFTLVDNINVDGNRFTIMDPAGVGSYRLMTKDTTYLSETFYGPDYKIVPNGFYRFKLIDSDESETGGN